MPLFGFLDKEIKGVNRKIKEIQRSDQKIKRRWLIGSTAVVMVIIVFLWIGYLNFTVPEVSQNRDVIENQVETVEEPQKSDSIFSVFSRGFKITIRSVSETFGRITDKVSKIISSTRKRLENVKEYAPSSN